MDAGLKPNSASNLTAWQAMAVDEVLKRLNTDMDNGLDASDASTRLQKYGPNRLPEGKKCGPFMRFLSQFNNILVYVLLGAGFTKLMLSLWIDAAIIFGVVIINALLGFIQEGRAEKALDSIRNMCASAAAIVRQRSHPGVGLAVAIIGRTSVLFRRRSGETHHPFVTLFAEVRYGSLKPGHEH